MSCRVLKNAVVWTQQESRNLIGTVSVRVFDVCATKLHISHEPCVRRHRFCMTTKSPTLNIRHQCEASKSPGKRGSLVFSSCCFAAHTPSHVSSEVCTFTYPLAAACQRCGPLVLHALCNHGENLSDLDCEDTTPLLRPLLGTIVPGFSLGGNV